MPTYYQTVVTAASGVMTGWRGTDPARYVEVETGVEVDPIIWDIWETTGAGFWNMGGFVESILPDSGGNNLPHLQIRWDSDGVWRQSGVGLSSGRSPSTGAAAGTRPSLQTTMSFRMANDADFIGGLYTPRSFSGLYVTLVATTPLGVTTLYSQATLSIGLSLTGAGPVRLRTGRSWAQVTG